MKDLFSGIGGFALGLEAAGMNTVAFCEQDTYCQKVLKKHWPKIPIHSDITELNGYEYRGTVDLVCGGFPCQPFSVAGKQLGTEDDRALWPEMLRVICEVAPRWVIGENVSGIIPMELDKVLFDLEGEGYTCWTFVLPACAVDAHHRRDRVWVVAHTDSKSQPVGSQYEQRNGGALHQQLKAAIKTPCSKGQTKRPSGHRIQVTPQDQVRMYPTPTARDYKGGRKLETLKASGRGATNSLNDALTMDGQHGCLNPEWVEWLMDSQSVTPT